jgi:hypothetical protein
MLRKINADSAASKNHSLDNAVESVFVRGRKNRIIGVLNPSILVLIVIGVHADDVSPRICEK